MDSARVTFHDSDNEPVRNIMLMRDVYDQYGILDITRTIFIKNKSISKVKVDEFSYQEIEELLARYKYLFSSPFMTFSTEECVDDGSYEIVRHSEFAERAQLQMAKGLALQEVPLYDADMDSNLYDMHYHQIAHALRTWQKKGTPSPVLSKDMIEKITENRFQSEITINAMRKRLEKRLVLK